MLKTIKREFRVALSKRAQPIWFRVASGRYCLVLPSLGGVTLARHGAGLLQTYRYIVENDLKNGNLQEVLKPFSGRSRPFSLIYPKNKHIPLRVRVFIDFLIGCAENGYRHH